MALTTYAELKTAITTRMVRTDMDTAVVDWITVAEAEIKRWLRVDWVEKRAYATPTDAFIALPTDFNGLRNLQWDYSNYRLSLKQVSPDMIDQLVASNTVGIPVYFCVHDEQFELRPAPSGDNATTVEISYWKKPTALSDSNTSNEILVNAPDLLFYRALAEGFDHVLDEQRAGKYMQLYEKAKADIMKDSLRTTWNGNPLQVRADSALLTSRWG